MPLPDEHIHPVATGAAAKLVSAHQEETSNGLVFYSGWFCPKREESFVQRSWISLEEKKISYQYREVNPYKKEAHFLKISPKGLVPALEFKGEAIPESLVICEFLEEEYPDSKPLLPKDALGKAHVRLAIDLISKSIIPAFFKLMQAQEKEKQDEGREALYKGLRQFEEGLKRNGGPFYQGEQLTLADIALIPFAARMYILEEYRAVKVADIGSTFKSWYEHVLSLESVKNTTSDLQHYEEIYQRYLKNEAQSEAAKATRSGNVIP